MKHLVLALTSLMATACITTTQELAPPSRLLAGARAKQVILLIDDTYDLRGDLVDLGCRPPLEKLPAELRKELRSAGYDVVDRASDPHHFQAKVVIELEAPAFDCWSEFIGRASVSFYRDQVFVERAVANFERAARPPEHEGEWSPAVVTVRGLPRNASRRLANELSSPRALAKLDAEKDLASLVHVAPNVSPLIAVFDAVDADVQVDPVTQRSLTAYFDARLAEALGVRVVPRDKLASELARRPHASEACDAECRRRLARRVSAGKSLELKIWRIGEACSLTSTLSNVDTAETESAVSAQVDCSDRGLVSGVESLIADLRADAER